MERSRWPSCVGLVFALALCALTLAACSSNGGDDDVVDAPAAATPTPAVAASAHVAVIGVCSLRSVGGQYLVAEGGGGGIVNANRAAVGPWETFTIELVDAGVLSDGSHVHLRAADGHYLVAEGGGGGALHADRTVAAEWETFTLIRIAGGGAITRGDAIALVTENGHFVVAEGGGGGVANADRTALGAWETWTFDGDGGGPVSATFQSVDGHFMVAEGGGGGIVNANRAAAGPWEKFTIDLVTGQLSDGSKIRIRASNDQYLRAVNAGGEALLADSNKAGRWETFTLHRTSGPGTIKDGDAIALETDNGHYVVAEGGGGGVVDADGTAIGPPSTWRINASGVSPLPPPPTRDQVVAVKADFGNLRDKKDRPMFTPFIFSLMDDCDNGDTDACADYDDWVMRLQAAGDTHIALSISVDYGEPLGWAPRYPIHGIDLTKRVPTLRTFVERLIKRGFIPILFLACDGHSSDPGGGYNDPVGWSYGLPWCQANLPSIIGALRSGTDLAPYILWIGGWDGCFPDWSPEQTNTFHTFLRSLVGPSGNIATEFGNGYIHMGGGGADWYQPGLDEVDAFFIEFDTDILDPAKQCGVEQVAARMLGPAKTFTPDPSCDSASPPWYVPPPRAPRGPLVVVAWEYAAYGATRKATDPANARQQATYLSSLGFRQFGNGQPY